MSKLRSGLFVVLGLVLVAMLLLPAGRAQESGNDAVAGGKQEGPATFQAIDPKHVIAITNDSPTIYQQSSAVVPKAQPASDSVTSRANDFGSINTFNGILATGQQPKPKPDVGQQARPQPEVVRMIGPVSQDRNLNDLPYIPVTPQEEEEVRLTRHPPRPDLGPGVSDPLRAVKKLLLPVNIPSSILSFGGMTSVDSGCGCSPPDTDGDVGPNHYIQSVNLRIKIYDKTGNQLLAPTTYNSFFSALVGTPCNGQNGGDGVVFYDHIADRWVVSDFAFPAFPGTSFYQCIGVSRTSDPVAGGWFLYAVQTDPAHPTFLGDYPKFGLWPDAYYMSVNMFSNNTTFTGVRVYALDRSSMISGGPANTIAFTIQPADLGDQYSLLPATFRTGNPPPAGQPEWLMNIESPATGGVTLTQVFVRRFHVDFATPANSVFGVGASHAPDGIITVNGFVDAFTNTTTHLVPQPGTAQTLDTLGDKLMYPLVYQNRAGVESIYSSHTVNNNQGGTGPTAIRWYQFNVTGNTIPPTPVQQQTFNNGADGLWRWMPSINVDSQGNLAINYTASSPTVFPSIRYAGRLAGDAPNNLTQGEATLIAGAGSQTSGFGRWGDYSSIFVDPADNCTFWLTHEYYSVTSNSGWNTRIGTFKFPGCGVPTPDLTISKTHTGNFGQGDTGKTYTITVRNNGIAATSGAVSVTDSVPAGLVATSISGTNWNCTQPAGPCTRSDALGIGNSYEAITLTVSVACNAPANVTNTAQVSGGGEVNTSNDTATDPTTINPGGGPPPTITCPGSITKYPDPGQFGATTNPGTPVAGGGCPPISITGTRSDGKPLNALYPIGTTIITWTARSANNKTASCAQTIIVLVPSGDRKKPDDELAMAAFSLWLGLLVAWW